MLYLAWRKNLNKEYLLGTGRSYTINYIAKLFDKRIKMIPNVQERDLRHSKPIMKLTKY